ncbi:MAG: GTP-binding protein [Candidatus Lokiarchaeota archaeon]|nr:GTP-binding protein [Candidatus Lokiarchaeota archaeon]
MQFKISKTSLLARYVDDIFRSEYHQTIGANFLIKEIDLNKIIDKCEMHDVDLIEDLKSKGFKLYFWDIGGQTDKLFVTEYYFIRALGAMVIFNVADKESFKDLDFWISKMKELSGEIPFILVGNKIDLENKRLVSAEEIKKKAEQYNVDYFETSAKLNESVDKAFEDLSIKILNNFK